MELMRSAGVATGKADGRVRLDTLTGLRWWAAFGVFVYHMMNFAPVPGLAAVAPYGNYGVAFFFVLSGFVLTYSAHGHQTTVRNFYWRRFARIYPLHLVALLLAVPVFYTLGEVTAEEWWVKPFSLGLLLLSVLLVQGWSRDPVVLFSGNPAAWTLTVEVFFYALHPWVNKFVSKVRARGAVVMACMTLAVCFLYWVLRILFPGNWLSGLPLPITRVAEFLLGMALAQMVIRRVKFSVSPNVGILALAGYIVWQVLAKYFEWTDPVTSWARSLTEPIIITLCAFIILASATRDMRGGTYLNSHPTMVKLGAWSFAFYLVHATVMYVFLDVFGHQPSSFTNLIWYIPVFAIAVTLAALLYKFVEHPVERKLRRWGNKHLTDAK